MPWERTSGCKLWCMRYVCDCDAEAGLLAAMCGLCSQHGAVMLRLVPLAALCGVCNESVAVILWVVSLAAMCSCAVCPW